MSKFFILLGIASLVTSIASAEEVVCSSPPSRANSVYHFVNQIRSGVVWLQSPGANETGEWTKLGNARITRGTTSYSFRASLRIPVRENFAEGECFKIRSTDYHFQVVPDAPVLEDGGSTIPVSQYLSRITIVNNLAKKGTPECEHQSEPRPRPFNGVLDCRTPIQR